MRPVFALLICMIGLSATLTAGEFSAAEKAQIETLKKSLEKSVSVEFVDLPLVRVLEWLSRKTEVPINLAGTPNSELLQYRANYSLENVHALDLLDVICEQAGLQCEFLPAEVRVHKASELRRLRMRLVAYALDDITCSVADFPAPSSMLWGSYYGSDSSDRMSAVEIADLIRTTVRPESWDPAQGTSIEERSGVLVIVQTEEVHAQIRRLLAGLRARAGRQVSLEAWVYAVPSANLDRLWADIRTRGGQPPTLDNAAVAEIRKWAEDGTAQPLYAGSTVLFNRQRGHWGDVDLQLSVTDLDVSGQTYEPIVRSQPSGTMLEACPILNDDGTLVSLSVQAGHTHTAEKSDSFQVVRGGPLVSSGDATQNITIKRTTAEGEPKTGDVTGEFEITNSTPRPAARRIPSYRIPLTTTWYSRVSQDLVVPAGAHVALAAPLSDAGGFTMGREMLVLLRCRPMIMQGPLMEPEQQQAAQLPEALAKRLEKKVTLTFVETPFEKALKVFSEQTGVPLVLDPAGLSSELREPVTWEGKETPAGTAFKALLQLGSADVIPYPSLLLVTSQRRVAAQRMTLRIFDLSDLNRSHPDYPGEGQVQVQTADPTDASHGGGASAFVVADMTQGLSAENFLEIFRTRLMPGEFENGPGSIHERGGQLVVFQTPAVLARIEQLLAEFRQTARRPVKVQGRWMVVSLADLKAAVGEDLPATLDAGLARKAEGLLTRPTTRDVAAGRLNCFNHQRVSSYGGCLRPQVTGYSITEDVPVPDIRSLPCGALFDITPLMMEGTGEQGVPGQLRLDVRASLLWVDPTPPLIDPVMADEKKDQIPVLLPGAIQASRTSQVRLKTSVRVVNGGAALFRFPVPSWIAGEDQEKTKSGERLLVLVLHAEQ